MTSRAASPTRVGVRLVMIVLVVVAGYLAVSAWQVWRASRRDEARPADAIVVLGAAQYNGRPSPDLAARLDHALGLWKGGLAPLVVVTGGRAPGDRYSEAGTGVRYLQDRGVPASALLAVPEGRDTWQSMRAVADALAARGAAAVLLVSDPFHDERISLMASDLHLRPYVSPTRTSPIKGTAAAPYYAKETVEVAAGRLVGFGRLASWGAGLSR